MSEFVRICRFLSEFVGFRNDAFSRCKVTKKKIGTVSLCQFVSVYVTLCHFPIYCLFLDAKLQKVNLALSLFVTFCHLLSPFSKLLFHDAKLRKRNLALSAFVRICPEMSAFVRISFSLQSYEKKNWHCPALSSYVHLCPFMSNYGIASSRNLRCKVTKSKIGTVQICPIMSKFVHLILWQFHFPLILFGICAILH